MTSKNGVGGAFAPGSRSFAQLVKSTCRLGPTPDQDFRFRGPRVQNVCIRFTGTVLRHCTVTVPVLIGPQSVRHRYTQRRRRTACRRWHSTAVVLGELVTPRSPRNKKARDISANPAKRHDLVGLREPASRKDDIPMRAEVP
jgi:hypothetical protein